MKHARQEMQEAPSAYIPMGRQTRSYQQTYKWVGRREDASFSALLRIFDRRTDRFSTLQFRGNKFSRTPALITPPNMELLH